MEIANSRGYSLKNIQNMINFTYMKLFFEDSANRNTCILSILDQLCIKIMIHIKFNDVGI